jgi:hypothetical protein
MAQNAQAIQNSNFREPSRISLKSLPGAIEPQNIVAFVGEQTGRLT